MASGRITTRTVGSMIPPETGRTFLWDDKISGFGCFVTPSGRISYVLQYRIDGKSKRFTIGRHGSPWTPKQARGSALGLLSKIANGVDPMEEKKSQRTSKARDEKMLFVNYVAYYDEHHVKANKLRTAREFYQITRDYLIPAFGKTHISQITKTEIVDLMDGLSVRSHSVANKVFDWMRNITRFANRKDHIPKTP